MIRWLVVMIAVMVMAQPAVSAGEPASWNESAPQDESATQEQAGGSRSFVEVLGLELHGFVDLRAGVRTQNDPVQADDSLGEARFQLDVLRYFNAATIQLRADFLYDWSFDDSSLDLDAGKGWVDLREANVQFSPFQLMDVKIGRQILTWGTGDLVFINDLFPKDFQSFFIGRAEEYLKAPSDAVFVSLFHNTVNLDIAYTPRFDADRFLTGERISFFNPGTGGTTGASDPVQAEVPDEWFTDDEIALRLYRNIGGYELAVYGYLGFWKSPLGFDPVSGNAIFPGLQVLGASVRGQVGRGIGYVEVGYYDSLDDKRGDDPLLPNGEARLLFGYQQEIGKDRNATVQYYLEHMLDHRDFLLALPPGQMPRDEDRHVLTARLTQLLMSQNLRLSLFVFYSPSDKDGYLRPSVSYKLTDRWLLTGGSNLFFGEERHTFFGQLEDNSNVYAGLRYSF